MTIEKSLSQLEAESVEYRPPTFYIRREFMHGIHELVRPSRAHLPSTFTVMSPILRGIRYWQVDQEKFEQAIFGTGKESFCTTLYGFVATFPKADGRYTGEMACMLLNDELRRYRDPQVAYTQMMLAVELQKYAKEAELQLALLPTR